MTIKEFIDKNWEEHRHDHLLREIARTKKNQKFIDDFFKRLVDRVRKEKKAAMHAARYPAGYKRAYNYFEQSKVAHEEAREMRQWKEVD